VVADSLSRDYGNANPLLTYTVGGSGLVNGDTLAGSLATAATLTGSVGAFAIAQGTLAASSNYSLGYTAVSLSITARPITVTADAEARIYGNANPALTYTVGGSGLVNGDTLLGGLATAATLTSSVGGYAIAQGTLAASSNYSLGYTAGSLSITARPITVTADAETRIYGNANPALTYSVGGSGLVNGDTLAGSLATAATLTSNVGGYAIAEDTLAASSNYSLGYTAGALMGTPRPLVVTADATSRIYGNANPVSTTATGDNFVNGDTVATVVVTSAAGVTSSVGRYDLVAAGATGSGLGNYAISYATRAGGLDISARPITITADAKSRTYGDGNPALTYVVGGNGPANEDTLSGALVTMAAVTSPSYS